MDRCVLLFSFSFQEGRENIKRRLGAKWNYDAACWNHVVGAFEEGGVSVRQIELLEWLIVVI